MTMPRIKKDFSQFPLLYKSMSPVPSRNQNIRSKSPSRIPVRGRSKSPKPQEKAVGKKSSKSPSPSGVPRRIRKGRGFTERYSFARKYRTPSPERSPPRRWPERRNFQDRNGKKKTQRSHHITMDSSSGSETSSMSSSSGDERDKSRKSKKAKETAADSSPVEMNLLREELVGNGKVTDQLINAFEKGLVSQNAILCSEIPYTFS